MAALTNPTGTRIDGGNQVVTRSELAANESIGWYVNPGGVVYQRINILTHEVRYIGRLEEVTDLRLDNPDTKEEL